MVMIRDCGLSWHMLSRVLASGVHYSSLELTNNTEIVSVLYNIVSTNILASLKESAISLLP